MKEWRCSDWKDEVLLCVLRKGALILSNEENWQHNQYKVPIEI